MSAVRLVVLTATVLLAALPQAARGLSAREYAVRIVGGWQRELRGELVVKFEQLPGRSGFRLLRTDGGTYRTTDGKLVVNARCERLNAAGHPTGEDAVPCPLDPRKARLQFQWAVQGQSVPIVLRRGTVDLDLDGDGVTGEIGYMMVTEVSILVVAYSQRTDLLKFDFLRLGDPQRIRVHQILRRYQVQVVP